MKNISETRLAELLRIERKMQALEVGGVDNWEWYDESLKEFRKEEDIDNLVNESAEDLIEYITTHLSHDYPAGVEAGTGYYFEGEVSIVEDILKTFLDNMKGLEEE